MDKELDDPFLVSFKGRFENILRWEQLDEFWSVLHQDAADDWYIYAIGETPPTQTVSCERLKIFLSEVDQLLRKDHDEDYCGIVYTDSTRAPQFVKIFDPNNLGVSCGFSDNPPLPGWILSKLIPVDLNTTATLPGNRRRWWRLLLGT